MRSISVLAQSILLSALVLAAVFADGKTTIDPNTGGRVAATEEAETDARLEQVMTYQVKLRPISDLTADLTALTGITFYAGRTDSDWRVREDCATVMAKDIRLGALMDSIAHAMKFRWLRRGKSPSWTYRLVEDDASIAEVHRRVAEQKDRQAQERRECWERLQKIAQMSPDELEHIKESDPRLYLEAKAGILGPAVELIQQVPDARNAWLAGESYQVAATWLPENTRQLVMRTLRAQLQLNAAQAASHEATDYYGELLADLANTDRTIVVGVDETHPMFPISQLRLRSSDLWASVTLSGPRHESDRLRERTLLRAYEEQRSISEAYGEVRDRMRALQAKEQPKVWIDSFTQEPLIDHPDDPAITVPLAKKVESKTCTGLIAIPPVSRL